MRRFGHPSGGFWKGYKDEKIKYRRTTDKGLIRVSPVFYLDWDSAYDLIQFPDKPEAEGTILISILPVID